MGIDDHGHGAAPRETMASVPPANLRRLAARIGVPDTTPCGTSHRSSLTAHPYDGRRDLEAWAAWCSRLGVHPFAAERHHVDAWDCYLPTPQPCTGRLAAASSITGTCRRSPASTVMASAPRSSPPLYRIRAPAAGLHRIPSWLYAVQARCAARGGDCGVRQLRVSSTAGDRCKADV
jgi:hypothetical protein